MVCLPYLWVLHLGIHPTIDEKYVFKNCYVVAGIYNVVSLTAVSVLNMYRLLFLVIIP